MTIDDVRKTIAKQNGYDNWVSFIRDAYFYEAIMKAEDECMMLYAQKMCEQQRLICHSENRDGRSIINSPFPGFE